MSRCTERRMLQTLLATGKMTHTKIVSASVNPSSLKDFWLAVVALIAPRLSPLAHIHRAPRYQGGGRAAGPNDEIPTGHPFALAGCCSL